MIARPWSAAFVLPLFVSLSPVAAGCGGGQETVLIGGEKVDPAEVDRDPLALLPSGIILLGYLDAAALFSSGLGADTARLVQNLLPLGPESNFVPSRDVVKIYGGAYAMQGADFCSVLQGNFDVDAIKKAADAKAVTVAGSPLVKTRYADMDMFTAGNVGFVVITSHTILAGNETGMRRALDRLRSGKLERAIPPFMIELAQTKGAAFSVAGDLTSTSASDAASRDLPFLQGLKKVRVVGNFAAPGVNVVGTLSYADAQAATNGAATLKNLQGVARFMSLLALIGIGSGVPPMQVAQQSNDVAFTLQIDQRLVQILLGFAASATSSIVKH